MKIIKDGKLNKLIPDDGYLFKDKNDNYNCIYDEDNNIVKENFPYTFDCAYLPDSISLENIKSMYDELLSADYPWKNNNLKKDNQ